MKKSDNPEDNVVFIQKNINKWEFYQAFASTNNLHFSKCIYEGSYLECKTILNGYINIGFKCIFEPIITFADCGDLRDHYVKAKISCKKQDDSIVNYDISYFYHNYDEDNKMESVIFLSNKGTEYDLCFDSTTEIKMTGDVITIQSTENVFEIILYRN